MRAEVSEGEGIRVELYGGGGGHSEKGRGGGGGGGRGEREGGGGGGEAPQTVWLKISEGSLLSSEECSFRYLCTQGGKGI